MGVAVRRREGIHPALECLHPLLAVSHQDPGDGLRPSATEVVFNGQEQRLLLEANLS